MHPPRDCLYEFSQLYNVVIIIFSILNIPSHAQLIISEIYRDPPLNESSLGGGLSHEFVEITNLGPQAFLIDSVFITNGLEADSIIPIYDTLPGHEQCVYKSRIIAPGAAALILDPDYRRAITEDPLRRFPIAFSTILLQCGDDEFGSGGLASDHGVALYRGTKTRIDTVLCSAVDTETVIQKPTGDRLTLSNQVNREGKSLVPVKILFNRSEFDYSDISPGWYEPLREGWLMEYVFLSSQPQSGGIECVIKILSAASRFSGEISWTIVASGNKNRNVLTGSIKCPERKGEITVQLPIDYVILRFILMTENNPGWDIDLSPVISPPCQVRITEVFPKATSSEPEWFEITNSGSIPVNLKNWRFGNGEDTVMLTGSDFRIHAGGYAVVTKTGSSLSNRYKGVDNPIVPSVWPPLNNSSDTLMLFDASGMLRETVCWDARWFENWPYLSLERNDNGDGCSPLAWSVAARSTPGQPNSSLYWRSTETPSLDVGPIPFTPDGDGRDDRLAIRLLLPADASVALKIYGFDGRIIKQFSGLPQEICYWDGRSDSGAPAPPGPFFVVAEVRQGKRLLRIRKKGILWRK